MMARKMQLEIRDTASSSRGWNAILLALSIMPSLELTSGLAVYSRAISAYFFLKETIYCAIIPKDARIICKLVSIRGRI